MNISDTVKNFVAGDALIVQRQVLGVPNSKTIASARIVVKRDKTDADGSALVDKSITPTSGANGQVTDIGTSGTGVVTFNLTGGDTQPLSDPSYFEITVTLSDASVYTNNIGEMLGVSTVLSTHN